MKSTIYVSAFATLLFSLSINSLMAVHSEAGLSAAPPIHLVSFSAIASGTTVQLAWSTGSETDNDFFTIERSPDGVRWNILEVVQGNGTISTQLSYGMSDHQPYSGTSYYRLKQTDFNGSSTYSDEVEVFIMNNTNLTVYPNPAQSLVSIEAVDVASMDIKLLNVAGQEIPVMITKDQDRVWMALNTLPPGTYFLNFQKGELNMTEKLIIE